MRFGHLVLAAATASGFFATTSQAALIGTSVTGDLRFNLFPATNYFDPANGLVPAGFGYLNTASPTVTVGEPATEFGMQSSAVRVSANVTDTQVLLQEQALNTSSLDGFTIKLTDAAFIGAGVSIALDTFPGTTAGISGNVLTLTVPSHTQALSTLQLALYNVTIPEPTSAMALGGVALVGLCRRRRA